MHLWTPVPEPAYLLVRHQEIDAQLPYEFPVTCAMCTHQPLSKLLYAETMGALAGPDPNAGYAQALGLGSAKPRGAAFGSTASLGAGPGSRLGPAKPPRGPADGLQSASRMEGFDMSELGAKIAARRRRLVDALAEASDEGDEGDEPGGSDVPDDLSGAGSEPGLAAASTPGPDAAAPAVAGEAATADSSAGDSAASAPGEPGSSEARACLGAGPAPKPGLSTTASGHGSLGSLPGIRGGYPLTGSQSSAQLLSQVAMPQMSAESMVQTTQVKSIAGILADLQLPADLEAWRAALRGKLAQPTVLERAADDLATALPRAEVYGAVDDAHYPTPLVPDKQYDAMAERLATVTRAMDAERDYMHRALRACWTQSWSVYTALDVAHYPMPSLLPPPNPSHALTRPEVYVDDEPLQLTPRESAALPAASTPALPTGAKPSAVQRMVLPPSSATSAASLTSLAAAAASTASAAAAAALASTSDAGGLDSAKGAGAGAGDGAGDSDSVGGSDSDGDGDGDGKPEPPKRAPELVRLLDEADSRRRWVRIFRHSFPQPLPAAAAAFTHPEPQLTLTVSSIESISDEYFGELVAAARMTTAGVPMGVTRRSQCAFTGQDLVTWLLGLLGAPPDFRPQVLALANRMLLAGHLSCTDLRRPVLDTSARFRFTLDARYLAACSPPTELPGPMNPDVLSEYHERVRQILDPAK